MRRYFFIVIFKLSSAINIPLSLSKKVQFSKLPPKRNEFRLHSLNWIIEHFTKQIFDRNEK